MESPYYACPAICPKDYILSTGPYLSAVKHSAVPYLFILYVIVTIFSTV